MADNELIKVKGIVTRAVQYKENDKIITVLTTASVSLPAFVISVILLWVFGVKWHILPTRGDMPGGMILPTISLML